MSTDPFIETLTRHKPVTVTQSLVSCSCETPGLLFDGWVEWAEHVAAELLGLLCAPAPEPSIACVCARFGDTGGYRIADLACPIHGVNSSNPGDWQEVPDA